jgi:hypothetical protein
MQNSGAKRLIQYLHIKVCVKPQIIILLILSTYCLIHYPLNFQSSTGTLHSSYATDLGAMNGPLILHMLFNL